MDEVQARFKRIQKRMKDPETVLDIAAAKGFKDVMDHFRKEEGPGGGWPEWQKTRKDKKGSTVRKTKRGGSKLLQDTGRLRQSTRFRVLKETAEVFNQVKYAATHNFGDPKRNIKKRKFMWLSDKAIDSIVKTFARFFTK